MSILFIYNSEKEKQRDSVNEKEDKIVFQEDLKRIEMKIKNKFKLITKIWEMSRSSFKTNKNKSELFNSLNWIVFQF